jgi:hypothetical protein
MVCLGERGLLIYLLLRRGVATRRFWLGEVRHVAMIGISLDFADERWTGNQRSTRRIKVVYVLYMSIIAPKSSLLYDISLDSG